MLPGVREPPFLILPFGSHWEALELNGNIPTGTDTLRFFIQIFSNVEYVAVTLQQLASTSSIRARDSLLSDTCLSVLGGITCMEEISLAGLLTTVSYNGEYLWCLRALLTRGY